MSQEEDDAESGLVAELRALAGAGAGARREEAGDDGTFDVRRGRHTITVIHNSGSSSNLRLRVAYDDVARADHPALPNRGSDGSYRQAPSRGSLSAPRPLAIALDHETLADALAVAEGIRREHQTGDHAFDRAVFVGTPTTDDAVLRAVLNPEVRAAVLSLFALGFLRVTIDDAILPGSPGFVEAYLWSFASSDPPAERGARSLDAFVRLLDHLPAITPSTEAHAPPDAGSVLIRVLGWVGAVGVLAGALVWWLVMSSEQCMEGIALREHCGWSSAISFLVAFAAGVIASLIARPALILRFGERSGSFVPVAAGRLKVFAGCAVLAFFTLFFALFFALRP